MIDSVWTYSDIGNEEFEVVAETLSELLENLRGRIEWERDPKIIIFKKDGGFIAHVTLLRSD